MRGCLWKSDKWLPSYAQKNILDPLAPSLQTRSQSPCQSKFSKTKLSSGMIMYQSNNTRDWQAKLLQEQLEKVMKNARLSKKIQKEKYRERMVDIHKKLVEKIV